MRSLLEVLVEARDRASRYRGRALNEQNTKATLIEPVLRALGWDLEDLEVVQREHKARPRAGAGLGATNGRPSGALARRGEDLWRDPLEGPVGGAVVRGIDDEADSPNGEVWVAMSPLPRLLT